MTVTTTSELLKGIENSSLSIITKRNYMQKAIVLIKLVDKPLDYIIENPAPVIKIINDKYANIGSRKTFYTFILSLFRYNPELKTKHKHAFDTWFKEFSTSDDTITERYKENAPTKRQVDGYIKFEDIIKKRDALADGLIDKLLLSFYSYIPPMRCDYGKVRLYETDVGESKRTEPNYIHDGKLVIRHFKTEKSHEAYSRDLPKEIVSELKKSLEKKPREWLFINQQGKPFLRNTYTQWTTRILKRLFGKPLTVSLIRHAYINTLDFNTLTIKEKEEIAEGMAHTVATQDKYRLIFK